MSEEDLRDLRSRQDRQQQREAKFAAVRQRVGSLMIVIVLVHIFDILL